MEIDGNKQGPKKSGIQITPSRENPVKHRKDLPGESSVTEPSEKSNTDNPLMAQPVDWGVIDDFRQVASSCYDSSDPTFHKVGDVLSGFLVFVGKLHSQFANLQSQVNLLSDELRQHRSTSLTEKKFVDLISVLNN